MKYLVALFLLAMSLQPFDLQACAIDAEQQPAHHATMHEGGEAECCSPDSPQPMNDCGNAAHCAFLSLGFLVIPATAGTLLPATEHHYDVTDGGHYSGPPGPPLFRPPIA